MNQREEECLGSLPLLSHDSLLLLPDQNSKLSGEIGTLYSKVTTVIIPPTRNAYSFTTYEDTIDYARPASTLKWLSLSFFLLAGLFYICAATWDYILIKDDIEDDDGVEVTLFGCALFRIQMLMGFLAGVGYSLTGLIDLCVARLHKLSEIQKHQFEEELISISTKSTSNLDKIQKETQCEFTISMEALDENQSEANIVIDQRKEAKKRENYFNIHTCNDSIVSTLLFIAGIIDAASVAISYSDEYKSDIFNLAACQIYFLEASIAMFGTFFLRICFNMNHANNLVNLGKEGTVVYYINLIGDFLFFVGSIIDLSCSILWLTPEYGDDIQIYSWTVGSSVLWAFDAMLYMLAAIIFEFSKSCDRKIF